MRELNVNEIEAVGGGYLSGYEGAGAIMTVLATGAAISTAPLSAVVIGISLGAAGGLALSQFLVDLTVN